jgi:hypothetical protein
MPGWFLPALKAILPHVGTIVSTASPVFTRKPANEAATNQAAVLQQQITELQVAATANDAHVKELATQLQQAVKALEESVATSETRYGRMQTIAVAGLIGSIVALGIAIAALFLR